MNSIHFKSLHPSSDATIINLLTESVTSQKKDDFQMNNSPMVPLNSISPYSYEYPAALLSSGINYQFTQAQSIVEDIFSTANTTISVANGMKGLFVKGTRYVVDLTEEQIQDINNGITKFVNENGNIYAQYKDGNLYGKKIPIKREDFRSEVNPAQIMTALQMQALHDQLEDITNQLTEISGHLQSVIQGQQNDRIGHFYAGLSLYLQSQRTTDPYIRASLIAQAQASLSESICQLRLNMQADIAYLESGEFNSVKRKRAQLLSDRVKSINQAFGFIHQSTMLSAGIYSFLGEQNAMAMVLNEYSNFLKNSVLPATALLRSYDVLDDGTITGLWSSRAELVNNIAKISNTLGKPANVLYLSVDKEKEIQ